MVKRSEVVLSVDFLSLASRKRQSRVSLFSGKACCVTVVHEREKIARKTFSPEKHQQMYGKVGGRRRRVEGTPCFRGCCVNKLCWLTTYRLAGGIVSPSRTPNYKYPHAALWLSVWTRNQSPLRLVPRRGRGRRRLMHNGIVRNPADESKFDFSLADGRT